MNNIMAMGVYQLGFGQGFLQGFTLTFTIGPVLKLLKRFRKK